MFRYTIFLSIIVRVVVIVVLAYQMTEVRLIIQKFFSTNIFVFARFGRRKRRRRRIFLLLFFFPNFEP